MDIPLFLLSAVSLLFLPISAGKYYTAKSGRRYFFVDNKQFNWMEAKKECESRNMNLVTPDTRERLSDIKNLYQSVKFKTPIWTAGQEIEKLNFMWSTTGNKLSYNNWHPSEPARTSNPPDCISMSSDFYWWSYSCKKSKKNVLCEDKLIHEPETAKKMDLDLLKSFYRNKTDFLLMELKRFDQIQLELLKTAHTKEMHNCEKQINNLTSLHEQVSNLLMTNNQHQMNLYKTSHTKEMDNCGKQIMLLMEEINVLKKSFNIVANRKSVGN